MAMRIVHVVQRYWPYDGGSERHARAIAERQASEGHSVTVLTTDAWDLEAFWRPGKQRIATHHEWRGGVEIRRFAVRTVPGSPLAYLALRRATLELARRSPLPSRLLFRLARLAPRVPELYKTLGRWHEPTDVFFGWNICFEGMLAAAYRTARRVGARFVAQPLLHLGEPDDDTVRRYYTMRHQMALLRVADHVFAQTDLERGYLVARGVAEARITIAPPAVEPGELLGGDGERFRQRRSVARPFVCFLGTAAYDKGAVHLVAALRRLWARGVDADLVVAGPMFDHVRAVLATLRPDERARCHTLGYVSEEEKRDLLAALGVLALPSRTDSFGIVFLEAWLYGKPVVGARAGGIPEVVADGVDGFLVPFGDVEGLAASLAALLADTALRARVGEAGRVKVLTGHTWEARYATVRAALEGAVARRGTVALPA
ncbi:MAG: glycosyltransferase family 4 protein [Chloroflexi bacterium]|nr:glycosyltransferase family 4 protein [Chloroflexota bacterium]